MATTLEYALLSKHVYKTSAPLFGLKGEARLVGPARNAIPFKGWRLAVGVSASMRPQKDCYGVVYIKFQAGVAQEAVIAFRGSHSFADYSEDFLNWGVWAAVDDQSDDLPGYYYPAIAFFAKAKQYLKDYFPSVRKLSLTGHSLGGALSQLIVAHGNRALHTVTFNAPGVGSIHAVNKAMGVYIQNINSLYGIINKTGTVLGEIEYVSVKEGEAACRQVFSDYLKRDNLKVKDSAASNIIQRYGLYDHFDVEELGSHFSVFDQAIAQHSIEHVIEAILNRPVIDVTAESRLSALS